MTLRPITLFGIVISMVTGIALGIIGYQNWLYQEEQPYTREFQEVLHQVHENYVQEVGKDELVLNALKGMLKLLPGMGGGALDKVDIDDKQFARVEAIINSMTPEERRKPDIINGSRRKRIARGSGTNVSQVNKLLKQKLSD